MLLSRLGFIIHPIKSVLEPTQDIEFLGFRLDTIRMEITLPVNKGKDVREACIGLLEKKAPLHKGSCEDNWENSSNISSFSVWATALQGTREKENSSIKVQ